MHLIRIVDLDIFPKTTTENRVFQDISGRKSRPMEALLAALTSSGIFECHIIVMISRRGDNVDPESPSGRAGSPSQSGGNPTAWKTLSELSDGGRYALAIRYAMKLSPGRKHPPNGVGTTLAGKSKISKNAPGEPWNGSRNTLHKGTRST